MQIFSLRLAKASINSGSVLLYGYMGARDTYRSMEDSWRRSDNLAH
jgi:hypothetical protein